jgi:tetratricopeptide (TPR) repeat protein
MVSGPDLAHALGLSGLTWALPAAGRLTEAQMIAEEALTTARARGNPHFIAFTLICYGRVFAEADPRGVLTAYREGFAYCRKHRLLYMEGVLKYSAAGLEAAHGDLNSALELFDATVDAFHRAGNKTNLALALAHLAVTFDQLEQPDIAVTLYGASTRSGNTSVVVRLPDVVDRLRLVLSEPVFDAYFSTGAAMDLGEAVAYARQQIRLARQTREPA